MINKCRVCGVEYDTCYSCEKVNSWRALTDTADHYYMLGVLMEYQSGRDAEKAHRALLKRDIDLTAHYLPEVEALLDEIKKKVGSRGGKDKVVKVDTTEDILVERIKGNTPNDK